MSTSEAPPEPAVSRRAPRVLVVVVACEPGDWFDQTLLSLSRQDHPNIAGLVVNVGASQAVAERVADFAPEALIVDAEPGEGYGSAANRALEFVDTTDFFCFCHDDVALAKTTISSMLREVARTGAGIIGPKLVEWDDPTSLQHVGLLVDKFGVSGDVMEPGEVDQEQHDAVSDVFALPGACLMVRADLMVELGGFDAKLEFTEEDVDLCWRAQTAGARVVISPSAVVRHREQLDDRVTGSVVRYRERNQLRMLLGNYSGFHLARVLPQRAVLAAVRILSAAVLLRWDKVRARVGAWTWNLRHLGDIRAKRQSVERSRSIGDHELRRLQTRGSVEGRRLLRRLSGGPDGGLMRSTRASLASSWADSPFRNVMLVLGLALAIYGFGSRDLFTNGVPAVGEFAQFPGGASDMLRQWWSGWRPAGFGDGDGQPLALGILGVLAGLMFGAEGLLRTVLIVGCIPIGAVGAWRMVAPMASRRAQLAAAVSYAAMPVPYNALREARWGALVTYAAAPFVIGAVIRAAGVDRSPTPWELARPFRLVAGALGLAITLVLSVGFAPAAAFTLPVALFGVVIGSALSFGAVRLGRLFLLAGAGIGAAALLLLPQLLDFIDDPSWAAVGGTGPGEPGTLDLADAIRFGTGGFGTEAGGWAMLGAASLVLLVGGGWRFVWGLRGWCMAFASWGLVWLGQWGALSVELPAEELLLAPGAAGLALAIGMGAAAFDADVGGLSGGVRAVASVLAACALAIGIGSVVGASVDGRWYLPKSDLATTLRVLEPSDADGSFRTLWIGDQDVLSLDGWALDDDLTFATSDYGLPTLDYRWVDAAPPPADLLRDAVLAARDGQTSRLGAELADFGVRYVVLVERLGPIPFGDVERPIDDRVVSAFSTQLDLERIEAVNRAVMIFENAAWASTRSAVPRAPGAELPPDVELGMWEAVLVEPRPNAEFRGSVPGDREVFASYNADSAWRLSVDGDEVPRRLANGWANAFLVDVGGEASLTYSSGAGAKAARFAQLAGLVAAALFLARRRLTGMVEP